VFYTSPDKIRCEISATKGTRTRAEILIRTAAQEYDGGWEAGDGEGLEYPARRAERVAASGTLLKLALRLEKPRFSPFLSSRVRDGEEMSGGSGGSSLHIIDTLLRSGARRKLISMLRAPAVFSLSLSLSLFVSASGDFQKNRAKRTALGRGWGCFTHGNPVTCGGGARRARKRAPALSREKEKERKETGRKHAHLLLISAVVDAVPCSSVEFRFARCYGAMMHPRTPPGSNRRPSRKSRLASSIDPPSGALLLLNVISIAKRSSENLLDIVRIILRGSLSLKKQHRIVYPSLRPLFSVRLFSLRFPRFFIHPRPRSGMDFYLGDTSAR